MKCPKCNEDMILDDITDQYFCEECCKLFDAEDLEQKVTVPILLLSFLMWIPILNFILLPLVDKKPAEDRKAYYSIFLSSLLFQMLLLVCVTFTYKWYKETELRFARQTLQQANEVLFAERANVVDFQYPEILDIKEQIRESIEQQELQKEKEKLLYPVEFVETLDGAYISGEHLRYLIERYDNYTYLLQTKSLRSKHQNINIYLNIGRYIREAEGEEHKLIDCSLHDTFTQLLSSSSYDAIDLSSTIYYVYNTEMFRVDFIYNKNDEIIGMSFTELEV